MQNFRKRIAVQKQQKEPRAEFDPFVSVKKTNRDEVRSYILRAILMYEKVVSSFEPLSDEEKLCRDEILKYKIDLEIIDRGTYEEGKEVVKKYGRIINQTVH